MKKAFAIGVESIGFRNTFCVALADDGDVLAATRHEGHICYTEQPPDEVAFRLHRAISGTLATVNGGDSVQAFLTRGGRVAAGITGAPATRGIPAEMAGIWQLLDFPVWQCFGTGAAEVLLLGNAGSLTGASLLWNSGSVAYARKAPDRGISVGGWGPMIADEGSGLYMGLRALRALTWDSDRVGDPCPELFASVRKRLQGSVDIWGTTWRNLLGPTRDSNPDDRGWMDHILGYCKELLTKGLFRYAVADLVPAVVEAAEEEVAHDKPHGVANRIVGKSIQHVVKRFDRAVDAAALTGSPFPVALGGGVLIHNKMFREPLLEHIRANHPRANVCEISRKNICHTGGGAALLALAGSSDVLPPKVVAVAPMVRARSSELLAKSLGLSL